MFVILGYYATLVSHVEKSQIDIVEVTGVWLLPILLTLHGCGEVTGILNNTKGFLL